MHCGIGQGPVSQVHSLTFSLAFLWIWGLTTQPWPTFPWHQLRFRFDRLLLTLLWLLLFVCLLIKCQESARFEHGPKPQGVSECDNALMWITHCSDPTRRQQWDTSNAKSCFIYISHLRCGVEGGGGWGGRGGGGAVTTMSEIIISHTSCHCDCCEIALSLSLSVSLSYSYYWLKGRPWLTRNDEMLFFFQMAWY